VIIQVNDKYRISSDSNSWTVQRYVGKRKDGKHEWEGLYYCVDFESALVSLAEYRIRTIADSATVDEIKATLRIIRDECVSAAEVFRELVA
jgi:hypothetical protein